MANVKAEPNVKNNSTALSLLNVNCLSQDGITSKILEVKINTHESLVAGMVEMAREAKKPVELPKVKFEEGTISFETNCRGHEISKGKVSAVAGYPPKFLNASKGTTKTSRDAVVFGRSR